MATVVSPCALFCSSLSSRTPCKAHNGGKPIINKQSSYVFPLSKGSFFEKRKFIETPFVLKSHMNNSPLISPNDDWGVWTALLATGTLGLWSEKTKIGSMISAALVSILLGLAASNLGIIPHDAPAYLTVFQYLLPLTIPMLLFRADLRQVVQSTGTLFLAFLLGSGCQLSWIE